MSAYPEGDFNRTREGENTTRGKSGLTAYRGAFETNIQVQGRKISKGINSNLGKDVCQWHTPTN